MRAKYQGDMLHCDRMKIFIDGVLETYTALMLEGYPDQPDNLGAPLFTVEEFNDVVARADRHKLQISTHAIADGAVRRTLDGYENAAKLNGRRDSRHRIEHIEMIDPRRCAAAEGTGRHRLAPAHRGRRRSRQSA